MRCPLRGALRKTYHGQVRCPLRGELPPSARYRALSQGARGGINRAGTRDKDLRYSAPPGGQLAKGAEGKESVTWLGSCGAAAQHALCARLACAWRVLAMRS